MSDARIIRGQAGRKVTVWDPEAYYTYITPSPETTCVLVMRGPYRSASVQFTLIGTKRLRDALDERIKEVENAEPESG